ncbi:MAG: aromatic acid exporter family protein [Firmicutes bacterium]|nr:aromatic acid exporter family protein [Bacillota bacterium]
MKKLKKINFNKVIRIAVGSTLSFFVCHLFGIQNSASAAVITLLSIQDTKKDTLSDVVKRFFSYLFSIIIAFLLFNTIGYNEIAFLIFMFILVIAAYKLDWLNTLSSSTVVTTHFLLAKTFAPEFVADEIFLVAVGTTSAVLLNLMFIDTSDEIRRDMEYIEADLKSFLRKMRRFLLGEDALPDKQWLDFINTHLEDGLEKSLEYRKNVFDDSDYYYDYMIMRSNQMETLLRIYDNLAALRNDFPLKSEIAEIFRRITDNVSKRENFVYNRPLILGVISKYKKLTLPSDMTEMINMAALLDVLHEFLYYSDLKKNFAEQLTPKQRERYYKEGQK